MFELVDRFLAGHLPFRPGGATNSSSKGNEWAAGVSGPVLHLTSVSRRPTNSIDTQKLQSSLCERACLQIPLFQAGSSSSSGVSTTPTRARLS